MDADDDDDDDVDLVVDPSGKPASNNRALTKSADVRSLGLLLILFLSTSLPPSSLTEDDDEMIVAGYFSGSSYLDT